nr:g-type lectin s-receptor-like serine/threonine-protein kinase rlk1 [Quercus suber]
MKKSLVGSKKNWVRVILPTFIKGKVERSVENDEKALSDLKWVKKLVMVAILCIQDVSSSRPSMREVIHMLEGIHEISTPPCPFLFGSTSDLDFRSS